MSVGARIAIWRSRMGGMEEIAHEREGDARSRLRRTGNDCAGARDLPNGNRRALDRIGRPRRWRAPAATGSCYQVRSSYRWAVRSRSSHAAVECASHGAALSAAHAIRTAGRVAPICATPLTRLAVPMTRMNGATILTMHRLPRFSYDNSAASVLFNAPLVIRTERQIAGRQHRYSTHSSVRGVPLPRR